MQKHFKNILSNFGNKIRGRGFQIDIKYFYVFWNTEPIDIIKNSIFHVALKKTFDV